MIEEFSDLKWIPYFLVFLFVINPSFGDSNFSNIQRMVSKNFFFLDGVIKILFTMTKKRYNLTHRE